MGALAQMATQDSSGGGGVGLVLVLVFYIAMIAFFGYVYARIARKAGFSAWWVALLLVPLVNIALIIAFAFVQWPVERHQRGPAPVPPRTYGYPAVPAPTAPGAQPQGWSQPAPQAPAQQGWSQPAPQAPAAQGWPQTTGANGPWPQPAPPAVPAPHSYPQPPQHP